MNERIDLIQKIILFHAGCNAGVRRKFSSFTFGKQGDWRWDIMLEAPLDELRDCLNELNRENNPMSTAAEPIEKVVKENTPQDSVSLVDKLKGLNKDYYEKQLIAEPQPKVSSDTTTWMSYAEYASTINFQKVYTEAMNKMMWGKAL